jgi:predicted metalloprotease with PDZ domain
MQCLRIALKNYDSYTLGFLIGVFLLSPTLQARQGVYATNRLPANGIQIAYRIAIEEPALHTYRVEIDIRGIEAEAVRVAMPAWAPGDRRIVDFARNVQEFQARARSGRRSMDWRKTDKQTWEILKERDEDVLVTYEVYSSGLTSEMADISGPATYMYVVGHKHVPVSLRYDKPRSWDVHTGLERQGSTYRAPDYDVFIDAPALVADARVTGFSSGNVDYRLVFSDSSVEFSEEQILADVEDIVDATVSLFGSAPFEDYTFLFRVLSEPGSDGVGHLNSARISVGEGDFSSGQRYDRFLFVIAREFIHAWNGKRIRPESEEALDYTQEAYSRLLWATDGLTQYYARLILARTGILDSQTYLAQLGQQVNLLQHQPGRFLMSLEEASWDVWTPSDNLNNNSISHWTKGELAGLLLDIEIRARTGGAKTLDDVLRLLMEEYADRGIGVPEDGFLNALHTVAGSDFSEFYQSVVRSRIDLDYARYATQAALSVRPDRQIPILYMGVQVLEEPGNLARVSRIFPDSPAQVAGLERGDVLVAFNDRRITFANFEGEFRRRRLGETVALTVLRENRLVQLELEPSETRPEIWTVVELQDATPEQLQLRNHWMGELN